MIVTGYLAVFVEFFHSKYTCVQRVCVCAWGWGTGIWAEAAACSLRSRCAREGKDRVGGSWQPHSPLLPTLLLMPACSSPRLSS